MPSYIPEHVYGQTGWDKRCQPLYGLMPWPEHLKPRDQDRDIQLTKKGESYVQAALAEADGVLFLTLDRRDRTSIATTIERLINLLDTMEPDPDLEPTHGWNGDGRGTVGLNEQAHDDDERELLSEGEGDWDELEPTMGWQNVGSQGHLEATYNDECEDVSEDEGACIQSQPHDEMDEGDREPFLGWSETCSQGPKVGYKNDPAVQSLDLVPDPSDTHGSLGFHGDGCVAARTVLRNLRTARPDIRQEYVGGWCSCSYEALRVEGLTIKSIRGRKRLGADELKIIRPGVAMVGGYRP